MNDEYEKAWADGDSPDPDKETPLKKAVEAARKRSAEERREFEDAYSSLDKAADEDTPDKETAA